MPTARELLSESPTAKALIIGATGSGKTTWAARSPLPLIVTLERQSIPAIVRVAPDAYVELCASYADAARVFKAVTLSEENGDGTCTAELPSGRVRFATLVIDSLSALSVEMIDHLTSMSAKKGGSSEVSQDTYGKANREWKKVMSFIQRTPTNVVATALAAEYNEEDRGVSRRVIRPDIIGSTKNKIGAAFSMIGFASVRSGLGYAIGWRMPERYTSKMPPTDGFPTATVSPFDFAPGATTLGSLLCLMYPGESRVQTRDGDSAKAVLTPSQVRKAAKSDGE